MINFPEQTFIIFRFFFFLLIASYIHLREVYHLPFSLLSSVQEVGKPVQLTKRTCAGKGPEATLCYISIKIPSEDWLVWNIFHQIVDFDSFLSFLPYLFMETYIKIIQMVAGKTMKLILSMPLCPGIADNALVKEYH